jgi:hypothetical protein
MTDLPNEVQDMVEMECVRRRIPPKIIDEIQAITQKAVLMTLSRVAKAAGGE